MIAHDLFPAQGHARFNIVLVHGMMEHGKRYHAFAQHLAQHGGNVITFDLRGHGQHLKAGQLGDFGDPIEGGAQQTFSDIEQLFASFNNDLPNILFGHSMGSTIALRYAQTHSGLRQIILSGIPTNPPWLLSVGYRLAKLEQRWRANKPSLFMASFKQFNQQFKPNRTEFDWLSLSEANIVQYINDPLCGQPIAPRYYVEMFDFMRYVFRTKELAKMDKSTSILMVWGANDPCTQMGKGPRALLTRLQKLGLATAQIEYPQSRHEILNEANRAQVFDDITRLIQA